MMKLTDTVFKVIILIIGIIVIAFNALLYNFCEKQKMQIEIIGKQQQIEAQVNNNKFKYQQEQIESLGKDLDRDQQQIKDQKDALADQKNALLKETEKRQQIENEGKNIQISLVDIKAEADAIKQEMKEWQKDYVSVLAELEKKMSDSQGEIKSLDNNLVSLNIPELKANINSLKADIEKITHPPDNVLTDPLSRSDKKIDNSQLAPSND